MKDQFHVAEQRIADLKAWYIDVIYEAAERAGGKTKLAHLLHRDRSFIHVTLARGDFGALREAVRKIIEGGLI